MPRLARVVIPGVPHHVTQRGNNRQDVFFTEDDRRLYLEFLAQECRKHAVVIHGYCLMTNHVHIVATPPKAAALAAAIGRAHWKYTQLVNRLHARNGHLWQSRFYSAALDEPHYWSTLAYVERNPIRANMSNRAWEYPWSSAALHLGRKSSVYAADIAAKSLLDMAEWERQTQRLDWESILARPEDHERVKALRRCTMRGRPLGSDSFIARLEAATGKRLRALAVGRPRRKKRARQVARKR